MSESRYVLHVRMCLHTLGGQLEDFVLCSIDANAIDVADLALLGQWE